MRHDFGVDAIEEVEKTTRHTHAILIPDRMNYCIGGPALYHPLASEASWLLHCSGISCEATSSIIIAWICSPLEKRRLPRKENVGLK